MIEIREAVLEDALAIAEVHVQAHRETYPPLFGAATREMPGIEGRFVLWRKALAREGVAYVAAENGRIIGFGHATGDTITTLYILAVHHRQRIGSNLLLRLLKSLRSRGIAEARLNVLALNT